MGHDFVLLVTMLVNLELVEGLLVDKVVDGRSVYLDILEVGLSVSHRFVRSNSTLFIC
jgi:hypothetical protein